MMFSLILTALLLAASGFDATRFRIPNPVPLALIALFALKVVLTDNPDPWPAHLVTFGVMLALGFLAFAGGLIGGGDAKLLASLGLWFGPSLSPSLILITGVSGGLLAVALMVVRQIRSKRMAVAGPSAATGASMALKPGLLDQGAPIPYALPISAAALWLEWL
jgi:prepilin peptidase CpaA